MLQPAFSAPLGGGKKATRCGAFPPLSWNDGIKGKKAEKSGGGYGGDEGGCKFIAPLCPKILIVQLCNHVGDDDTVSLQNHWQSGTSVSDVRPTERWETVMESKAQHWLTS